MTPKRTLVAVALPGRGTDATLIEAAVPAIGPKQVMVRIEAAGICGTQVHQLDEERRTATLLGHEAVGVVERSGIAVRRARVGDRVLLSWIPGSVPHVPMSAQVELDDGRRALTRSVYTLARHVVVDEAYVCRVPPAFRELPSTQLAIVGCAVLTGSGAVLRDGALCPGDDVVVIGLGGIGLAAVATAVAAGACRVVAIDLDPNKLQLAASLGATAVIDAGTADAIEATRELGLEPALVVDAAGTPATTRTAIDLVRRAQAGVRRGGRVVLLGGRRFPLPVDADDLVAGGIALVGCLGGSSELDIDVGRYLELLHGDRSVLSTLVGEIGELEDLPLVLRRLRAGEVQGRAVVRCGDNRQATD